jgi:hypothetical protein
MSAPVKEIERRALLNQSLHLQHAEFCQAVGERAAFQCRPSGHAGAQPFDAAAERLGVQLLTSGQVVVDDLAEA